MEKVNFLAILCVACASATFSGEADVKPPAAEKHEAAAPQNDLPGIKNFAKVSEGLYRGEQPTAEGFATLKKMGIKTIVCLRMIHGDRDMLKGLGLQYVSINCKAWHPEDEDVAQFLKVAQDPKNQPVFVHCQHGSDRTGTMIAAYRIIAQNWTNSEAEKELRNFGYHEVFAGIQKYVNQFDKAKIRALIEKADVPKIESIP